MRLAPLIAATLLLSLSVHANAQTAVPSPSTQTPAPAAQPDPEARARFEKFRAACGTDLQTHCGSIARGTEQSRNELRQCIETNKLKFSAGCQAAIAERAANRGANKQGAPTPDKPKS